MDKKAILYPDRVLSLVVMVLSIMMIAGTAYLYNVKNRFDDFSARIIRGSENEVNFIKVNRAAVATPVEIEEE